MYKFIIIFFLITIISSCSKKTLSVLPDNTLNNREGSVIKKNTILSDKERNKIASIVGVDVKKITNDKLYALINKWLGVPYFYGGETEKGIDCSAITQIVMQDVYGVELPRNSYQMFWSDKVNRFKKRKNLKEGDLVFFRIDKKKNISHVGIYLQNNKFFSSNVSGGVEIADLNSNYWSGCYVASGRMKLKNNIKQKIP